MSEKDLKALTYINLPFIEDGRFEPGQMIPYGKFVESEELARKFLGDQAISADEQIAEMIKWGSISEDADAPLHHAHRPVDIAKPTLSTIVAEARALIEELEADGADVPAKLRALAEISDRQIADADGVIASEVAQ